VRVGEPAVKPQAKYGFRLPGKYKGGWRLFGEKCGNDHPGDPNKSNYFDGLRPQTLKDKGLAYFSSRFIR